MTHDMEEAFRFCTDLLVLDRGCAIASGPKHRLFEDPGTVAAARLTGCKNIIEAVAVNSHRIAVAAWNCELTSARPVDIKLTHIGYRSHQIRFVEDTSGDNVFPCWLVSTSEAPHEMTLYLRLHSPAGPGQAAQLQADVPKDVWRTLSSKGQPWNVKLEPARLLILQDKV
ncbi:MAG: hypothetical protein JF563_03485 [Acidobacteriales bacterium]|nr:hypothetical protein [Terriglobales bacterium]